MARTADVRASLSRRGIEPAALPLTEAAAYVGLSPNTFLAEVLAGTMPAPIPLHCRRKVWSRTALDSAVWRSEPTATTDPSSTQDIDAAIESYAG